MTTEKIPPIHPGEILRQEFLGPLDLSPRELADGLGVDSRRVSEILGGRRAVTADMAPGFWLSLQKQYEFDVAFGASSMPSSISSVEGYRRGSFPL